MCALLGGASAAQLTSAEAGTFAAVLDSPRAWLSPGIRGEEPSPGVMRQYILEVLCLKLRCMDALVRVLIGQDHSNGLAPSQVVGVMHDQPGRMMPARWSLDVAVHPTSTETQDEPDSGLGPDLSKLFTHLLLANDNRTPDQAEAIVANLTTQFLQQASASSDESSAQLHTIAGAILASSAHTTSNQALHAGGLRNRAGATLPTGIWNAALTLILRLRTDVTGFSFSSTPLVDLYGELTALAQRLDIATFGAVARREETAAIVRSQLEKLPR